MAGKSPENSLLQQLHEKYNPKVRAHRRKVRKAVDTVGIQIEAEEDSRQPNPDIADTRRKLQKIIDDGKK